MRFLVTAAILALILAGCGKSPPRIERHTVNAVQGQVIWKGKPLKGAILTFHPKGWELHSFTPAPTAVTGADGHYRLSTYGTGDGAPAGKYIITVTCSDPTVVRMGKPNILPKQYAKPETSGVEVDIVEGANEVPPLDLGGKPDPEPNKGGKPAPEPSAKK